MKFSSFVLLLFSCLLTSTTSASGGILTEIRKSADSWTLIYTTESPIQQLVFKRNPDHSRTKRWTPTSTDYQITNDGNVDLVNRLDGKPFSEVAFVLTPDYIALPKDYAPFVSFSDGGMLIHSGRFFACPERCEEAHNNWHMALVAPESDTIILDGATAQGRVEWLDSDDGRKIYVGPQQPNSDELFISVIDPGLPEDLRNDLQKFLPLLVAEYAKSLDPPEGRPMLFASYDAAHKNGYGRQGGVLPGQIFVHWYGENPDEKTDVRSIIWFFAHEVAHLFQRKSGRIGEPEHAWIHEGAAEYMAGLAMKSLIPETSGWVDARFRGVKAPCLKGLQEHALVESAERQRHRMYYTCGLFIHDAIGREAKLRDESVNFFTIWSAFQETVDSGEAASFDVFIHSLRPFVSDEFVHNLETLTTSTEANPERHMNNLASRPATASDRRPTVTTQD